MQRISVQAEVDLRAFLTGFSKMEISDLEVLSKELNTIIEYKKSKKEKQEISKLLVLINQSVLTVEKLNQYQILKEKLQLETINDTEYQVFLQLVKEDEALRNQRIKYMIGLAKLRKISLSDVMLELGLKPL